jgi:hypothetical protein
MTTPQNYVVYTAPTEKGRDNSDYLSVAVTDVRGGQTWTSGTLWIYDPQTYCLCGDASGDGLITSSDVVYLINYLFAGGLQPDPLEKADVNNDGEVNFADAVYLINYLFAYGAPPNCHWIH